MKGIQDGGLGEDRSSPGLDLDYCGDSDSDKDSSDSDEDEYNLPTKRKVGESTHPALPSKKRKTNGKKYESQLMKQTQQAANPPPRAPHEERVVAHAVIPSLNNTVRLPKMQTGFVFLDNHCCDCASVPSRSDKRCQVLTFITTLNCSSLYAPPTTAESPLTFGFHMFSRATPISAVKPVKNATSCR
jgi:hypothetical protein